MSEKLNETIVKAVELGTVIRRQRREGNLLSVVPPTMYGYMSFVRMSLACPHMSPDMVASATLLGNASESDRRHARSILNEVFGLHSIDEEDPMMGGNLF